MLSMHATGIPEASGQDFQLVVRGNRAWTRTTSGKWASMPVPKEMNGKSGSMGADAFQQLARYVRDVRVAEHQQIEGKLGDDHRRRDRHGRDAQGGHGARSLSGARRREARVRLRPRRPRPEDRRHQGGALDRRAHPPARAGPRHARHGGAGKKLELELRYRLTSANQPITSRASPASTTRFGAWTRSSVVAARAGRLPLADIGVRRDAGRVARGHRRPLGAGARARGLAGIAVALGTNTARTLYDNPEYDALLVAVWAVIAGGIVAFTGYFIVGGLSTSAHAGSGALGDFRRARHILGFAVAPLALSLLLSGRSSSPCSALTSSGEAARTRGRRRASSSARAGLRRLVGRAAARGRAAVHGWTWARSLGALGLVALFLAGFASLRSIL